MRNENIIYASIAHFSRESRRLPSAPIHPLFHSINLILHQTCLFSIKRMPTPSINVPINRRTAAGNISSDHDVS